MFAAYLAAQGLPILIPRPYRTLRWLFPLAMLLAGFAGAEPWIPLVGIAAGLGSAATHRPPAWLAGLYGGPGWAGVLGAVAGFVALAVGGPSGVFWLAAALAVLSALDHEDHEVRVPASGALRSASVAMVIMLGFRVIEPALVRDRLSAALFGVAWAAGVHVGWARAPLADARGTLALPFIAAAGLAGLSVVEGPGMVFLWALVALAVGGVLGVSDREGRFSAWPWVPLLAIGAVVGWLLALESLDSALWTAGSVALIGGFGSLLAAGRAREVTEVPAEQTPAPLMVPSVPVSPPSVPEQDEELAAAIMLLEALKQARKIRSAALEELTAAVAQTPVLRASQQARSILAELTDDARRVSEQLRAAS